MADDFSLQIPYDQIWCIEMDSPTKNIRAYRYNINLAGGQDNANQWCKEIALEGKMATRFDRYHLGAKFDDIPDHSKTVVLIESNTDRDHFDYLPPTLRSTPLWENQWTFRHYEDFTNVLFVDGHVPPFNHADNPTVLNEQAVRPFSQTPQP